MNTSSWILIFYLVNHPPVVVNGFYNVDSCEKAAVMFKAQLTVGRGWSPNPVHVCVRNY